MMIELKELAIVLDDGRSSYCGGEMLRGHIVIDFEERAEMRNIQVRFYGEGYSQIDNVHGSESRSTSKKRESIVDLRIVLFGLKSDEIPERIPMHSHGRHEYNFNFLVPKYVPCSFESPKDREYGMAYLRYFLEATITRPWSKDVSKQVPITVNQIIDTSLPEYSFRPGCQTEKQLGVCFPDGRLYIEAFLNDVCYSQSSNILITCRAENDSKRVMSSLYAKLFKRTRYRRKKETRTYLDVVSEYFGDRVLPKKTASWDNLEFKIPADVAPTITKSNRVNVDYFVRVGMYQLFREEIHVDLPIVIGTTKAYLMEKRKMEQEKNQELSICVGDDPTEISQPNGLLCPSKQDRRASESNLHVDSKPKKQVGGKGTRVKPGSTLWKNAIGRPPMRKAASHSGIDTRTIGSSVSNESRNGKKLSSSGTHQMQQTDRKHFDRTKVDLKDLADIAIRVGYARRASNIKSLDVKQNGIVGSKGKKTDARGDATKERSGEGGAEKKRKTGSNGIADVKSGDAAKTSASTIKSSPSNASMKEKKVEQDVKVKSVAPGQRKISSSIQDRQLKANGISPQRETNATRNSKLIKNEGVQRSKAKTAAVNAFAKGAPRTSLKTSNGTTNTVKKNEIGEKKKIELSQTKDSTVSRKVGTTVRKLSSQPEKQAVKGKLSPKSASILGKKSSSAISAKEKDLKGKNVEAGADSVEKKEDQSNDEKKKKEDLKNDDDFETVDESRTNDVIEKNITVADDTGVDEASSDSVQNHTQTNILQDGLRQKDIGEEEFVAVMQETTESSPKMVPETEDTTVNSHVSQSELKTVPETTPIRNEGEAVPNLVTIQNEVDSASSPLIVGNESSDNITGRKSREMHQEDVIIPVVEEINVESSPFSFEDLEEDFMIEESRNGMASKESLIDEGLIRPEESAVNLERAPSLDEFELIESQLLVDEDVTEGKEQRLNSNSADETILKGQSIKGSGAANEQKLEHVRHFENRSDLRNNLNDSESIKVKKTASPRNKPENNSKAMKIKKTASPRNKPEDNSETMKIKKTASPRNKPEDNSETMKIKKTASPRSKPEDASRSKERTNLTNRRTSLTTKSTNVTQTRKTSGSRQGSLSLSDNVDLNREKSWKSAQKNRLSSNSPSMRLQDDVIEGPESQASTIRASNGYANGNTDESETATGRVHDGRHVTGPQALQSDNVLEGIDVGGDIGKRDETSYLEETSSSDENVSEDTVIAGDENGNDITDARSRAEISWGRTFTKIRTMQSTEKSRRKSVLNIKVFEENSEV